MTTPSLRSTVNPANPNANDDPGAAPNGADYVALQGADGQVAQRARDLRSVSFTGAQTAPAAPAGVDDRLRTIPTARATRCCSPATRATPTPSAVTPVTVPTADPTLRFLAKYGAEFGFDYGYVQVSTDSGATYTTIPGDNTIDAPLGPGLNGTTTGFEPHSYDLSAYAGQTILVAIRYVSDGGVNEGGLLVDDITVGGTTRQRRVEPRRRSSRPPRSTRSTVAQLEPAARGHQRGQVPVVAAGRVQRPQQPPG